MSFVTHEEITFNDVTVHVAKLSKNGVKIQGSVDGNQYGQDYDVTTPGGFFDKGLIEDGYIEAFAGNGSIFYEYEGAYFAEGVEIVQGGVNNQDFGMSCVSDYNNAMAVGFLWDGSGIVFDRQSNITENYWNYYSAITGAFGIMKDGTSVNWGQSEHSSQYAAISGRTILGQNDDYIFHVAFAGTTGTSGLYGNQLYSLCNQLGMKDACCFDGGGSVWQRIEGEYTLTTTRKVKNAFMIFYKEIVKEPVTIKVVKKIYRGSTLLWENK